MMGRYHPKLFLFQMIRIANNRSLTENLPLIIELEQQDGGWMDRETRQMVSIVQNRADQKETYVGGLVMSRAIGTRSETACSEALVAAKAASYADRYYRRVFPNGYVFQMECGTYSSGFGNIRMGNAVWRRNDIDALLQVINRHDAYDEVDPETSMVSFSLEDCRFIRSKLSEVHNVEKMTYHVRDVLRLATKKLPFVMEDGAVRFQDGYHYLFSADLTSEQHDLVFASLEVGGAGPWDYSSGHAYCLADDPTFPLSLSNYRGTARSRMRILRLHDPVEYDRIRSIATYVGCGRDGCNNVFRSGHASLATAPKFCSSCGYDTRRNDRTMVDVGLPPICRKCYQSQNFFLSSKDNDIPRNVCTCPGGGGGGAEEEMDSDDGL